jgi:hypothetical protein
MAKLLSEISLKILEVMKQHPEGIAEGEIRESSTFLPHSRRTSDGGAAT